ncbi:hypothetical protein GCM10010254_60800 [Streptomyces chromofuscus]|nr:hypothetical protein GCM10010254_60800 [Streptomyces chromofuscus]
MANSTVEPDGRIREGPPGFWKTPSRKWGDLRMRAMRSPLGSTPKAAGRNARSPEREEREPATVPPVESVKTSIMVRPTDTTRRPGADTDRY